MTGKRDGTGTRDGLARVRLLWRITVVLNMPWFAVLGFGLVTGPFTPDQRIAGGIGLLVVFVLYTPAAFTGVFRPDTARDPVVRIVACALIGVLLVLALGPQWLGMVTYAAYLAGGSIRRGPGAATAAVVAISAAGSLAAVIVSGDPFVALFGLYSVFAGLYGVGFGWLAATYRELDRARLDLARLAVAEERARFARDLHDLLGHSLSVIALKSELAGRLVDRDPDRARREVGDIESVTRTALAEVRAAVTGYRGTADLAAELGNARSALAAAGVTARIDGPTVPLPPDVEELLAWTVREGTTNIVRHAGARQASIRVDGTGVEVVDDGAGTTGAPAAGPCHGLDGLAERVAAVDGRFEAGAVPSGGFRLAVRVPRSELSG